MTSSGEDDDANVERIANILRKTADNLDISGLTKFSELVLQLGNEKDMLHEDEIKILFFKCTQRSRFWDLMPASLALKVVPSLIEIKNDHKLWKAVWKQISNLARLVNFSYTADFGEMDRYQCETYNELFQYGMENKRHIRLMVVGANGVGKTTMIQRLCDQNASSVKSTEGIEVSACEVEAPNQWQFRPLKSKSGAYLKRQLSISDNRSAITPAVSSGISHKFPPPLVKKDFLEPSRHVKANLTALKRKYQNPEAGDPHYTEYVPKLPRQATFEQSIRTEKEGHVDKNTKYLGDFNDISHNESQFESKNGLTTVSIWDFGGKPMHQSTHHIFLSARAIYILVLDISKDINSVVSEGEGSSEDCKSAQSTRKGSTYLDVFKFWMNSIYTYTEARKEKALTEYKPKIVLVGTFKDRVFPDMKDNDAALEDHKEKYFDDALSSLIGSKILGLVHEKKFFVSSDDPKEVFDLLKSDLTSIAKKQPFWNEIVPKPWTELEKTIRSRKENSSKTEPIMKLHELQKTDKTKDNHSSEKQSIKQFLHFQHALGNLLYYDTEDLEDYIILDPKWILDVYKLFVSHVRQKKPLHLKEWRDYNRDGILRKSLINEMVEQSDNESLKMIEDTIILLMEHLHIIAKPVLCRDKYVETISSDDESEEDQFDLKDVYIVTCRLTQKPTDEEMRSLIPVKAKRTPILCLVFKNNFLPVFVCHQLFATCIKKWTTPVILESKKRMLFNGFGRFNVNTTRTAKLDLWWKDYILYIQIFRCSERGEPIDPDLCVEVRKQIQNMLRDIFCFHRINTGKVPESYNVQYVEYIKCPRCDEEYSSKPDCDDDISLHLEMLKVTSFKKGDEMNCGKEHTVTREEALFFWFYNEYNDYKMKTLYRSRTDLFDFLKRLPADLELKEIHIATLSRFIGKEYLALAVELGLSFGKIEQIEMDEPDVRLRIKRILLEWYKISHEPTVGTFKCAFEKITRLLTIESVERAKEIVKWYEKTENSTECPSDRDLLEVNSLVGGQYRKLAETLFGTERFPMIEQIEMQYSLDFDRTLVMLFRWRSAAENATVTLLKDCVAKMFKIDREDTKTKTAEHKVGTREVAEWRNLTPYEFHGHLHRERQSLDTGERASDTLEKSGRHGDQFTTREVIYSRRVQIQDQVLRCKDVRHLKDGQFIFQDENP